MIAGVIIAGGRDFSDYAYLAKRCHQILNVNRSLEYGFISGGARGADYGGELYAKEYWPHNPRKRMPADWDKHGKAAGAIRNEAMAARAKILIAFWDGKSRGTKHMIDTALKKGLEVYVFRY